MSGKKLSQEWSACFNKYHTDDQDTVQLNLSKQIVDWTIHAPNTVDFQLSFSIGSRFSRRAPCDSTWTPSWSLWCCLLDNRINDIHLSLIAVGPAQPWTCSLLRPRAPAVLHEGIWSQGHGLSVQPSPTSVTSVSNIAMGTGNPHVDNSEAGR